MKVEGRNVQGSGGNTCRDTHTGTQSLRPGNWLASPKGPQRAWVLGAGGILQLQLSMRSKINLVAPLAAPGYAFYRVWAARPSLCWKFLGSSGQVSQGQPRLHIPARFTLGLEDVISWAVHAKLSSDFTLPLVGWRAKDGLGLTCPRCGAARSTQAYRGKRTSLTLVTMEHIGITKPDSATGTLFITNCPTELQKKHGFRYAPNQPQGVMVLAASVPDINRGKQQAAWKKMPPISSPSPFHYQSAHSYEYPLAADLLPAATYFPAHPADFAQFSGSQPLARAPQPNLQNLLQFCLPEVLGFLLIWL